MPSLYAERMRPPDATATYYERHYAVKADSFSDAFRRGAGAPIRFRPFVQPTEQSTEYFRDVMRRLDAYHVFHSFLNEGTRPFAEISFSRAAVSKISMKSVSIVLAAVTLLRDTAGQRGGFPSTMDPVTHGNRRRPLQSARVVRQYGPQVYECIVYSLYGTASAIQLIWVRVGRRCLWEARDA